MTLIKVSEKHNYPISLLNVIALKKIFDKKHMTYKDEYILEKGVEHWLEHRKDLPPVLLADFKLIVNALLMDTDDKFAEIKELFIKHKIDYRKAFKGGAASMN